MRMRCIDPSGPLELGKVYDVTITAAGMVNVDGSLWCIERFVLVEGEVPEASRECKCGIRREMCTYHKDQS
jgi:hypothetical protein